MKLEALDKSKPVMIDFFAEWCAPCQMLDKILEEVKSGIGGKAEILKIDIDQHPAIATRFNVKSVPTLVIMKNGQEQWRMSGFMFAKDLIEIIEKYY